MSANFRDALGDPSSPMNPYDAAPAGDILAQFDAATGQTYIPAGEYVCEIADGRLTTTKAGLACYLLTCRVSAGPYHGHRVYRRQMLNTSEAINRTKAFLSKLGLTNGAALQQAFPEPGRVITVRALVTVSEWKGEKRNEVERFDITDDRTAPPNPNAVDLSAYAATSTRTTTVTTPMLAAPVPESTTPRMIVPSLDALGPAPAANETEAVAAEPAAETPEPSPPPPAAARRRGRPRKSEVAEPQKTAVIESTE